MASIITRHRACSTPWSRLIRQYSIAQRSSYDAPLVLHNVNLCFQPNSRFFSAAAWLRYPRLPRGRGKRNEEDEEDRVRPAKDVLTQAQEDLENAAVAVTEVDKLIIKKLGHNASFEIYVKLLLSRLRPFLVYFVHLGPEKFLKGYAPQASSLGRARNATIFLFISAHAWLFHAMAARSSRSLDIPPPILEVAEKFTKAGNAVEAYVENKLPEGMGWADVGGAVLDSSSDAWLVMSKSAGQKDGTPLPSNTHDHSKESPAKGGGDIT